MDIENMPILGANIDKSQVPPIHQKRILAFINHFITSTCGFLNDFILNCENKFIDLERKIQRVEASLIIIESKIASIPGLDQQSNRLKQADKDDAPTEASETQEAEQNDANVETTDLPVEIEMVSQGVTAANDIRYRKYFKMMQFGVPSNAVKMKMAAEGYDADILDTPELVLPDGILYEPTEE